MYEFCTKCEKDKNIKEFTHVSRNKHRQYRAFKCMKCSKEHQDLLNSKRNGLDYYAFHGKEKVKQVYLSTFAYRKIRGDAFVIKFNANKHKIFS